MSLLVNLRHLDAHNVHLAGELPINQLDIDTRDEVIRLGQPLEYDLELQKLVDGLLVQGRLSLSLECQCVRCLKPFLHRLKLDPWTRHLPLQGDDSFPVINDCVDLTPPVREDILLEFPQHPLCKPDCSGLRNTAVGKSRNSSSSGPPAVGSLAWNELNKLKF